MPAKYFIILALIMMFTLVPSFAGMLALSQLPTDRMRWTRWAMYMLSVFATINGLSTSFPTLFPLPTSPDHHILC